MSRPRVPKHRLRRLWGDARSARQRRETAAAHADERQVEPTAGDLYQHGCDGDMCTFCDPDTDMPWDREQIRRRLAREAPVFSLAERVLAQVGIRLRLVRVV